MKPPDWSAELRKVVRLATAPLRPLPGFVLAGAPKCGTSTLYDYLCAHPDVRRGLRKEPTNFVHYPGSRFRSAMNFPLRFPGQKFLVGDASVEYFTHPHAPENVRDVVPDARLIFLFREPVQRAWSDYQMMFRFGSDRGDFAATVRAAMQWLDNPGTLPLVDAAARHALHPARYVLCGWYARAVERWLEVFPREQCLFLISEEFFAHPEETVDLVCRHLGLPKASFTPKPCAREGGYAEQMPPALQDELRAFYAPRNVRLEELLGRSLPWP